MEETPLNVQANKRRFNLSWFDTEREFSRFRLHWAWFQRPIKRELWHKLSTQCQKYISVKPHRMTFIVTVHSGYFDDLFNTTETCKYWNNFSRHTNFVWFMSVISSQSILLSYCYAFLSHFRLFYEISSIYCLYT